MIGKIPALGPEYFDFSQAVRKAQQVVEEFREKASRALDAAQPKKYANAMKQAATSVARSVGAMRRSLAGFDEIERMDRLRVAATVQKSKEQLLLEYLETVDFQKLINRLTAVRMETARLAETMNVVISRIDMTNVSMQNQEAALLRHATVWQSTGAYINTVATAQQRLNQMITHWMNQSGLMVSHCANLKLALSSMLLQLGATADVMETATLQSDALLGRWSALQYGASTLGVSLNTLRGRLAGVFDGGVQSALTGADNQLRQQLFMMQQYLQSSFFPAWKQAWSQIAGVVSTQMAVVPNSVKPMLNSTITLFNRFLAKLTQGFNQWVNSTNQLQLWLGRQTGIIIPTIPSITAPNIPLLAKGAVLPANNPFLAVVGDQHHGTNIEAPLTTIQEALATVLSDSVSANLAGHEATVAVLRQILEAVLGISVGDDVIGAAAQRYRSKMAVVTGGMV